MTPELLDYPPTRYMSPYSQPVPTHQDGMGYDDSESTILPRQRLQQNFQRSYTPLTGSNNGLSFASRHTPEPESQSFEMQPRKAATPEPFEQQLPPRQHSTSAASGGYVAFNPSFTLAAAAPSFTLPERSITNPPEITRSTVAAGPQRSATAPPEAYDGLIDEYRVRPQDDRRQMPGRSAIATPSQRPVAPMRSASIAPYQAYQVLGRSVSTAPLQPLHEVPVRSATSVPSQRPVVPIRSATAVPHQPYEVPGRSATAAPSQHYNTQGW